MPISGHRRSEAGKQEGALARPAAAFLTASLTPQGGHFLATIDTCVAAPPRVAALRRNRWPKSPESAEDQEIHVILDNLSIHTKKGGTWLARHPHVHFHFTPTNASWLNQIEVWFSILTVRVLRNGSFTSAKELRDAIERFTGAWCEDCSPFAWTKEEVHPVTLKRCYADLCN